MRVTGTAGWLLAAVACIPTLAQTPTQTPTPTPPPKAPAATPKQPAKGGAPDPAAEEAQLQKDLAGALIRRDWPNAEAVLRRQMELEFGRFVPYYNMACVRSAQGDAKGGMEWLIKAVARGFCDVHQMERDSYLKAVREDPAFARMVEGWPKFLEKRADTQVQELRKLFPGKLAEERDPGLRLAYLTAAGEASSRQVREEIDRVAAWCDAGVFHGLMVDAESARDPWVAIVVPNREGFLRWSIAEYGPAAVNGFAMVGGQYDHDQKQLVSLDAGATLRHEFVHVLHWRDMTRRGQVHAVYIQEGLASLVEDYDLPGGEAAAGVKKIIPTVSWRTNAAKRREKIGGFIGIDKLAALTPEKFTGTLPLANYAAARTLFLWVDSQGKLAEWYGHYTAHFGEDPTGVKSFEAVLGAPLPELNKRLRAWTKALKEVPEEILPGKASLGVEVEVQAADGVAIVGVTTPPGFRGRRPTTLAGEEGELRVNDVIRSIQGRPTRDMAELVRVLGGFEPGQVVEVELRRGGQVVSAKVRLIAK